MSKNSAAYNQSCNKRPQTCGCSKAEVPSGCGQNRNQDKCFQAGATPCSYDTSKQENSCFQQKPPCKAAQKQKPSRCSQMREQLNSPNIPVRMPTGTKLPASDCSCQNSNPPVSAYLEAISDVIGTLVEVLCICGIHFCKAKKATDTLINAFIKFDEIPQEKCKEVKKKMRRCEFFSNLSSETAMTGTESLQTYAAAKYAFKAFYFKQSALFYNPSFIDECKWHRAAQKTFEAFAKFNSGLSCSHIDNVEKLIRTTYDDYVERFRLRCQSGESTESKNHNSYCDACLNPAPPAPEKPAKCFTQPPKPKCKCCPSKKLNCKKK